MARDNIYIAILEMYGEFRDVPSHFNTRPRGKCPLAKLSKIFKEHRMRQVDIPKLTAAIAQDKTMLINDDKLIHSVCNDDKLIHSVCVYQILRLAAHKTPGTRVESNQ